jgi:hypothetical protein
MMLLVFQVRFMVSEVAAILQVVLEAVMLWYVVRMSHAASPELATKCR